MMNKIIFTLLFCFSYIAISGYNRVPADVYKQLCGQLEGAYEDLVGVLQSKDATIKAQSVKIIHLERLIKEYQIKEPKER